jgi:hypothetical protein
LLSLRAAVTILLTGIRKYDKEKSPNPSALKEVEVCEPLQMNRQDVKVGQILAILHGICGCWLDRNKCVRGSWLVFPAEADS